MKTRAELVQLGLEGLVNQSILVWCMGLEPPQNSSRRTHSQPASQTTCVVQLLSISLGGAAYPHKKGEG